MVAVPSLLRLDRRVRRSPIELRVHPGVDDDQESAEFDARHARYLATGEPALRDELIASNLGLAYRVAQRFANRGESLDDLVQVAALALLKAIDRFDPHRGVRFSTYAVASMTGELKRHFRDHAWALRVPRSVQELRLETNEAIETLHQRLGRSPTIAEIAQEVRRNEDDVLMAVEAGRAYKVSSLDTSLGDGDPVGLAVGSDDPALDEADERELISPLLARLPARERQIVTLRFVEGLTQSEIAERVGLSQMHVSRLLARSLDHLRELADVDGSVA
jgi:RNA polymerase sigma-B factor